MLSAEALELWRGDRCLFRHLSFTVDRGRCLLVRGPNGSGKTSLLRAIAGLTELEAGIVSWEGEPLRQALRQRPLLAYTGHLPGMKQDLSVRENLRFFACLQGASPERLGEAMERLGLADIAALEFRYLSAGQRRRAALARVLTSGAPLWLLDEPYTNLDVAGRQVVDEALDAHLESGGVAVFATHQEPAVGSSRFLSLQLEETD